MPKAEELATTSWWQHGRVDGDSLGGHPRPQTPRARRGLHADRPAKRPHGVARGGLHAAGKHRARPRAAPKEFSDESIKQLADSITKIGLLNPITIRWNPDLGKHVVVTGERRYRAVKLLGHDSIKCIFEGDEKAPEVRLQEQLIENCVREDLNDVDRANAFVKLRDKNGWNAQQLADALCVSKATVSRTLKLLELPDGSCSSKSPPANRLIGRLPSGHQSGSEDEKRELAARITTEKLSRDETAKLAGTKTRKPDSEKGRPPHDQRRLQT